MKKRKGIVSGILAAVMILTAVPNLQMEVQAASLQEENMRTGYQQLTKIDLGETDGEIPSSTLKSNRYAASTWDKYSSKYFYNQLSDAQKELYNSIYNICMSYLTTSVNAQSYDSTTGLTAEILTPSGLSQADAEQVIFVVITNNPQFYFLNEVYGIGKGANGTYVRLGVYADWISGAARTTATNQMTTKINSWMSQIEAQTSVWGKEQKAHDLVVANTKYAYGSYDQSCAGVFLSGEAVCAGYAEAFTLLCNGAGINTISVTSEEHEWNKIQISGNWYNVDCAWDDNDDGNIYYDYFNVSDTAINEGYHEIESDWNGLTIPACSHNACVYNGVDYGAVYDESYYVNKYSDIKKAFGSNSYAILAHFVNNGMSEGRQAISTFDVNSYRNQYPDLRKAFGNDLKSYYMHYINYGQMEGRKGTGCTTMQGAATTYNGVNYSAVYDYNYYIKNNPDVVKVYGTDDTAVLAHFVNNGMSEGRQAKSTFDVNSYRNQYPDLRQAFGSNLKSYYMHYITNGQKEGRVTTGCTTLKGAITTYNGVNYATVYDFNYYISKYPDLKKAFGNDDAAAIKHFVNNGMSEGRQAKSTFDVKSYKNQYPDLRQAFGNNLKSYYMHYITNGQKEGRVTTGCTTLKGAITTYNGVNYAAVYDFNYYISKYPDLKKAFGNDDVAAIKHFVNNGMSEGRQAKSTFDVKSYKNQYVDLRNAFGNNLKSYYMHYITNGQKENRTGTGCTTIKGAVTVYNGVDYSSVYNYDYYIANNPDVVKVYGSDDIAVLAHFVNNGMSEGRQASAAFNVNVYQNRYADLRGAFGNDLKRYYLHYINNGRFEGRSGI